MKKALFYVSVCLFLYTQSFSQLTREWTTWYDGITPTADEIQSTAVDGFGNLYITGTSRTTAKGTTINMKYSPAGELLWLDSIYISLSIVSIDKNGNAYFAGNKDSNVYIVKYSPSGVKLWENEYEVPVGRNSGIQSMTLDDSGNIYIGGRCFLDETQYGFYINKITPNGIQEASRFFQGAYDGLSMAFDTNGNMYVAGSGAYIINGYVESPYGILLKYNYSGDLVWSKSYHQHDTTHEIAVFEKIKILSNNEIVVAGDIFTLSSNVYLLVKYDSIGEITFERKNDLNGTISDLAVDSHNNIYLVGDRYPKNEIIQEFVTLSYNANGDLRWLKEYYPSNPGNEAPYTLAIDGKCNVYVVGSSVNDSSNSTDMVTIKYDSLGNQLWVKVLNDSGDGRDAARMVNITDSTIYVSGTGIGKTTIEDFLVLNYNPAGELQWKRRYNRYGSSDNDMRSVALDDSGSIYMVGENWNHSDSHYSAPVKFSKTGELLWAGAVDTELYYKRFDDMRITVDKQGNSIVGLRCVKDMWGDNQDLSLIKYGSEGEKLWKRLMPGNLGTFTFNINTDNIGNIILGYTPGATFGTYQGFHIVKFSPEGNLLWEYIQDSSSNIYTLNDLVLDDNGNVYLTATTTNNANTAVHQITTMRVNSLNGTLAWSLFFNNQLQQNQAATKIKIDSNNYIIILGDMYDSLGYTHSILGKYSLQGDVLWAKVLPTFGNIDAFLMGEDVGIDNLGNILAILSVYSQNISFKRILVKYSPAGNFIWSSDFQGNTNYINEVHLKIDSFNQPYIIGNADIATGNYLFIIKYNDSGIFQWSHADTAGSYTSYLTTGAIDADGKILLLSSVHSPSNYSQDYYLTKFSQIASGISTENSNKPLTFALHNAYPNPFNPTTTITYDIPKLAKVTLSIYNVLGQEVASLVNERQEAGTYNATFDASRFSSGVYFYRLTANDFSAVKKLLLVK